MQQVRTNSRQMTGASIFLFRKMMIWRILLALCVSALPQPNTNNKNDDNVPSSSKTESTRQDIAQICCICLDEYKRPSDIALFSPSGARFCHHSCKQCARLLKEKCPMCRRRIKTMISICPPFSGRISDLHNSNRIFTIFDSDGDGRLNREELKKALELLVCGVDGCRVKLPNHDVGKREFTAILEEMEKDLGEHFSASTSFFIRDYGNDLESLSDDTMIAPEQESGMLRFLSNNVRRERMTAACCCGTTALCCLGAGITGGLFSSGLLPVQLSVCGKIGMGFLTTISLTSGICACAISGSCAFCGLNLNSDDFGEDSLG